MEIGRVQPAVGDSTFVFFAFFASDCRTCTFVENTESEAKVGVAVGEVEVAEGIVGAARSTLYGWHRIGQASKDSSRLDLVINYLNKKTRHKYVRTKTRNSMRYALKLRGRSDG